MNILYYNMLYIDITKPNHYHYFNYIQLLLLRHIRMHGVVIFLVRITCLLYGGFELIGGKTGYIHFHLANEEIMQADALAHTLCSRDSTSFWKEVRKMARRFRWHTKLEMLLALLILLPCGKLTFPNYAIVSMIQARSVLFVNMLMLY